MKLKCCWLKYFHLKRLTTVDSVGGISLKGAFVKAICGPGGVAQWTSHLPQEREDPGSNLARVQGF
jgi:hypothetical protein